MPDFQGLNAVAKAAFSPREKKSRTRKDPVIVNRPDLATKLDRAGRGLCECVCGRRQATQDPAGTALVQGLCSVCTCHPGSAAGQGPVFDGIEGKTGPFDPGDRPEGQGGAPPGADVVGNYDCKGRHPLDRPDLDFPKNQNPKSWLAGMIEAEEEVELPATGPGKEGAGADPGKVDQARAGIRAAAEKGRLVLAYSGGADSTVLLDLAATTALTGPRPLMVWCDTGMEYPGSRAFVEGQAGLYGLELRIARAPRGPEEQFREHGWPMLGKMAARIWNQTHQGAGFTLNVSECCRAMKIGPARRLTRNLGAVVQLTGQRGRTDDRLRGLREHLDGALTWQARDRMWIASPLTGWTDEDVRGYARACGLPEHPAKACGAATIGCVYCGGGSQFTNSGYRILRKAWPEAWRRFMVEWRGGEIILALKYGVRLDRIRGAIAELGGLGRLAEERPWVFDFTRRTPLKGYAKGAR